MQPGHAKCCGGGGQSPSAEEKGQATWDKIKFTEELKELRAKEERSKPGTGCNLRRKTRNVEPKKTVFPQLGLYQAVVNCLKKNLKKNQKFI